MNISSLRFCLAFIGAIGGLNYAFAQAPSSTVAPAGATGLCRDGAYTYSQYRKGSCTGRGGVQEWFDAASNKSPVSGGDAVPVTSLSSSASSTSETPVAAVPNGDTARIHMVYMGGNDCPPCVAWRANELPLLRQTAAFRTVTFSYVQKVIASPVPPSFFLPTDVKPLKEKLDFAGGGRGGSAQVAILVNDEVYDYYFGSRSANEIEQMILAIRNGTKYPFDRCLKRDASKGCALNGS